MEEDKHVKQARKIVADYYSTTDGPTVLVDRIAAALAEAERNALEEAARVCDGQARRTDAKRKRFASEGEYKAAYFAEAWRNAHETDARLIRLSARADAKE